MSLHANVCLCTMFQEYNCWYQANNFFHSAGSSKLLGLFFLSANYN